MYRTCDSGLNCLARRANTLGKSFGVSSGEIVPMAQKAQCIRCLRTFPDTSEHFPLKDPRLDLLDHLGVDDYQCKNCIKLMLERPVTRQTSLAPLEPSYSTDPMVAIKAVLSESYEVANAEIGRLEQDLREHNQKVAGTLVLLTSLTVGLIFFLTFELIGFSLFITVFLNHLGRWLLHELLKQER